MPSPHPALSLTIFELRRYRARPGRRDELIALFEAHFRAAYEAAGTTILASWTVPDEPDRWVWIRAFTDAATRRRALEGFYGGEVWSRLGPACNATIADAREAYVLHALETAGLAHPPPRAALPDAPARPWALTLQPLPAPTDAAAAVAGLSSALAPFGPPPALALGHDKAVVLLRRFDTEAADAAFHAAGPGHALPRGTRHWRLQPTACSRLR